MSERHPPMSEPVAERAHGPVALPERITIRDVGPRDGLQAEEPMPIHARAGLIDMLGGANLPKIEAVSFVSPKAVPSMADAALVWGMVRKRPEVHYSALVPNAKGAEQARSNPAAATRGRVGDCPTAAQALSMRRDHDGA